MLKSLFLTMILAFTIMLCILLPKSISQFEDRKLIGTVTFSEAEGPVEMQSNILSIPEKLSYFQSLSFNNSLYIDSGRNFTSHQAVEKGLEELETLAVLGILPYFGEMENYYVEPCFHIQNSNPDNNFILWEIQFENNDAFINLNLDDDTGKILQFSLFSFYDDTLLEVDMFDIEETAENFGAYLGIYYINHVLESSDYLVAPSFREEEYSITGTYQYRYVSSTYRVSFSPGPDYSRENIIYLTFTVDPYSLYVSM